MCLLLKKHFYKPLKMLYRYKSKWYMPPKIKTKYGLSKANLLQKNFKRINKKNRVKSLKNQINEKKLKGPSFAITANAIPTLIKQKNNFSFKKKYIKTKFTKVKFNIKKKKRTIKKYLNKILKDNLDLNAKSKKIIDIVNSTQLLNKFETKVRALTNISQIRNLITNKNIAKRTLKKRLINSYTLISKYFSNYSVLQSNILTTIALLRKKKKFKKANLMFNYLKIKQNLLTFHLNEKESFAYNEDILDSNFLENNLREIWGITPAKRLSDYFLSKIRKRQKTALYQIIKSKHKKKAFQFRVKKKGKYKKNYDKMYYKKRRINFQERSYNRLGMNDVKKKTLKMKRRPFSLLHFKQKKEGRLLDLKHVKENLITNFKLISKKGKKKILFLNPDFLLKKLHQMFLAKNKFQLHPVIKTKFKQFVRLLKLELKGNSKKIKKYTKKILFYKKQKGLLYRKKKIEILNLREYFIRENHKLREEIKSYRYAWKNSPFFNYNKGKHNKLSLIVELRKQKNHFSNILKKYPEGIAALKDRIKRNQYYTGLSLLKRKLE